MITLSKRDLSMLNPLTEQQVRLWHESQILRLGGWPANAKGQEAARRHVEALCEAKLLERYEVMAKPLLTMHGPIARGGPDLPESDWTRVSWLSIERWQQDFEPTFVYVAGPQATKLFGGEAPQGVKQPSAVSHDLQVSEVFLRFLRTQPQRARHWVGEDILKPSRRHQKRPDAILHDLQTRKPYLVVEFAGAYTAARLRAFHQDCVARGLSYEIY